MKEETSSIQGTSRRDFIKKTAFATAGISAGLFASANFAYAGGKDTLRVGLIGCGGRGTGAARDCVASADNVELFAMGDLFPDRLKSSRDLLKAAFGDKCNVPEDRCYTGMDAYKKVIQSDVDLVLLTTPPAFRPIHLQEAVAHNKHVFMEKPVAVDPAGVRSVRESGKRATEKGLSVMSGLQYRKQDSCRRGIRKIHQGSIGRPVAARAEYLTGSIWHHEMEPGMSEVEWQLRNWYYYTWLSGDFIVEQFVHNLDMISWALGAVPLLCTGLGGRQVRVASKYGNIYDHFSIQYEFPEEVFLSAACRQMNGTYRNVRSKIAGSDGIVEITPDRSVIRGAGDGEYRTIQADGENPYQKQKEILIKSIRETSPLNETQIVADSTLMGIMGREAAYTGQQLTWEEIGNSELELFPPTFDFDKPIHDPVAQPGITTLDRRRL